MGVEEDVTSLGKVLGSHGASTDVVNMPSPLRIAGYKATDIHDKRNLLIEAFTYIKYETGHILLKLPDGSIIDTKGWNN